MSKLKELIVVPGEEVSIEEQYTSGRNTFVKFGKVKSVALGRAVFDDGQKKVNVEGKIVQTITINDIVYGKVVKVKDSMALIELTSAENNKKITSKEANLPVRNVSTEYISKLDNFFKIGDLVKAKVVGATPLGIDLATNEKGLGVIKAYCKECRTELSHSNGKLLCFNCGSQEERKWFSDEQKEREFQPRREFGSDRGFGGNRGFSGNRGFRREGPRRDFRSGGGNRFNGPRRDFERSNDSGEQNSGFGGNNRSFGRKSFDKKFNKRF